MALILNIETATPVCSVCIAKDGALVAYREDTGGNAHAKMLTVFIEELMAAAGLPVSAIDAVAVSAGPGSYTGLRIGTSVAKGLCYSLDRPLITVPTLLALAFGIKKKCNASMAHFMPVIDARRMDVYTSIFDSDLNEVQTVNCVTIDKAFESSVIGLGNIYIGGNGTDKCKTIFTNENIHFVEEIYNDSRNMINLSNKKFIANEFENIAWFEPFYLKEFPARM